MPIVIVGGDHLGGIEKKLRDLGATEVIHVTGRKAREKAGIRLPRKAAFILVLTDYVNHATAQTVKAAAKATGTPAFFAKRAWSSIEEQLITGGFGHAKTAAE